MNSGTLETESRASRFFDRYADDFNAIYGNGNGALERVVNRLFRQAMLVRYRKTLAGCTPLEEHTVLDVGCGPGHYSVALAQAGAARVFGLDFAPGMLTIAEKRARAAGVESKCSFVLGDFLTHPLEAPFDYGVLMGFMDYVREPAVVVNRVLEVVKKRAFFSFPADGGLLAWQRKLRYRNRCDLYLYTEEQLHRLMSGTGKRYTLESIGRDFFVTLEPSKSA